MNISESLSSGICPFSGLRPEALCNSSAFTAVYMLLIQDDPVAQRHFHQIPPVFMSSVTEPGSCQLSEQRFSDSPLVLATLVSLVPWCSDHVSHTETVLSGNRHRLIPPGCLDLMMTLCKRDSNQRPFVLLVLVDVLTAIDGKFCRRVSRSYFLYIAPNRNFSLSSCSLMSEKFNSSTYCDSMFLFTHELFFFFVTLNLSVPFIVYWDIELCPSHVQFCRMVSYFITNQLNQLRLTFVSIWYPKGSRQVGPALLKRLGRGGTAQFCCFSRTRRLRVMRSQNTWVIWSFVWKKSVKRDR